MGLDEALIDASPASGVHKLHFGTISNGKLWRRKEALNTFQPLIRLLTSPNSGTFLEEETKLERHLPSNINILSLENWTSSEVLMRLQYLGEKQKNLNLDPREILQKKYVKCHVTDMVGMRKIRDNCFNIIFQPLEIVTLILS
eukprot:06863.XXX_397403_396877_1 [CDS] Oithona nana genome sequencing.